MKKFLLTMLMLVTTTTAIMAQSITGTIVDKSTKEGVTQATVSLLKRDSSFIKGVISNKQGKFTVVAPKDGKYLLKITSVAYKPLYKEVVVSGGKNVALGTITMKEDGIMLKEAVATGQAARVVVKEDTFVYNADAYHTPEGSVVEELVKRLPGAQVSDDGAITINGKTVKKILVDGKEFMTGDTETALKNLPTSIIDKVKAFDQKSDLARVTGIDDGEEETVLDFGIKRGMNKGIMMNGDFAMGSKSRYAERLMAAYMKDNLRIMGFGSANNTGDMGFPGGGGGPRFGSGGNGLNASKMVGLNVNYQSKKNEKNDNILTIDGSVRWNHRDGDTWSKSSSEQFLSEVKSYGNSLSQAFSRSDQFNGQMRLEWNPDTMTNVMFRPRISLSKTDNSSASTNATFNDDPYETTDDPLSDEGLKKLEEQGKLVNTTKSASLSYSESDQYSAMAQYNRKLGGKKGRNFTLRGNVSYTKGASQSTSLQNIISRNTTNTNEILTNIETVKNDTTNNYRYNTTPTKKFSYTVKGTYTEPIARTLFLQGSYSFNYSKSKSDRSTYDLNYNYGSEYFNVPGYRNWDYYLNGVDSTYNNELSKYSEYNTYTHEAALQLRKVGTKWNYTVGIMFQPQSTEMKYKYYNIDTIVKRNVFNFAPSLDLRYKISKVSQLRATYRAQSEQPSMTDLLEIYDDSNPLNISTGNSGLKPSFTHNFMLFYNGYEPSHTQSWMTHINFSMTQNSVSSMVHYFSEYTKKGEFDQHEHLAGSKLTRPENINGNWNVNGALMYNTSIDSAGVWNINTFTNVSYNNRASYLFQNNESVTNTTRTTSVGERLAFSYRNTWLEVEPNGNINYTHTRNMLQSQNNLDTWSFNYGMNITVTAPWGTGFSTDAHMNSRRGYSDASMNTNEFVWNAQVSQSFLKGKPLTVSLQFYDLLHNQSTISRMISSTQRTDSEYNAINSYIMLHAIYRFNSFGGKMARRGGPDGDRPDFHDRRFDRNGGMPGPPPGGGFGGGHRGM